MKKIVIPLVAILILLAALYNIRLIKDEILNEEKVQEEVVKEEPESSYAYDENDLYAIENLGYDYKDSEKLVAAGAEFLDLGGDEYYYIEPRYDQTKINIYKNDINTDTSKLIFSTTEKSAIVLKCNESDIFSNVTVELITKSGRTTKFSPYISLKDGTLVVNEEGFLIK